MAMMEETTKVQRITPDRFGYSLIASRDASSTAALFPAVDFSSIQMMKLDG